MIRVNRKRVAEPKILRTEGKGGLEETKRNIHFIENNQWANVTFSVYSRTDVKDALIELFQEKCAYCESKCLHVYSGDVEHFRPKGEITEANPVTPGYYWLAASWDNLFLSCRNCNQQLKHKVFEENKKRTLGKMNQFPLYNGYHHVQTHSNHPASILEEENHRLLIDPCKDNPEEYFKYNEDNASILPKHLEPFEYSKAEKTIDVCALQ